MNTALNELDMVTSLQALPETDPVEVEGIGFNPRTCQQQCVNLSVNVLQTVCAIVATCK